MTPDGRQFGVTLVWLRGEAPSALVAPAGWTPGGLQVLSGPDLKDNYEFVGAQTRGGGRVETYRHRESGELIYIGRPQISPVTNIQTRYVELLNELKELEERPLRADRQQALASFSERTSQLVKDSHVQEPGPLLLQGIAARLLKQWELAAESFRAVTVLRPDLIHPWLDLTWSLAELGRLDEAESCARHAVALDTNNAQALGNLASVLLQRGDVEQAFTTINHAVEHDPTDSTNRRILERICKARGQQDSVTRAPWYRRLWGKSEH
jgi:tetratricopeptide (TPR) repeat protein